MNKVNSTNKLLIKDKPKDVELFLPINDNRKIEGGLRTKGYFKKSYLEKPLVTIVTVTYNSELFLEETIRSVLNQTYDNIEYIIIDGGSTDKTLDIIKQYEDSIDYFVSEPDNGMYDALNKSFRVVSGELVNFCNSDDVFYSNDSIKKIVDKYIQEKFDCCYGYGELIDGSSKHISYHYSLLFKKRYIITLGSFFIQPTFFWRKEIMQKSGFFDLKYKIASDRDFIGRIMLESNKIIRIEEVLTKFRKYGASFGDINAETSAKETLAIKNNFLSRVPINYKIEKILQLYDRFIQKSFRVYKRMIETNI